MTYYLDEFMTNLVKAHNLIASDQGLAISIIKKTVKNFQPKDEDILYLLSSACDIGLDSPIKFKELIVSCMDKVQVNHEVMLKQFKKSEKSAHGKQVS